MLLSGKQMEFLYIVMHVEIYFPWQRVTYVISIGLSLTRHTNRQESTDIQAPCHDQTSDKGHAESQASGRDSLVCPLRLEVFSSIACEVLQTSVVGRKQVLGINK